MLLAVTVLPAINPLAVAALPEHDDEVSALPEQLPDQVA